MPVIINESEVLVTEDPAEGAAPRPQSPEDEIAERPRLIPGPSFPFFGVFPALVVDNEDPDGQGRVKVRLPWAGTLDDDEIEIWARLATLLAGPNRGTWFIPDIDDEVLVAFEAGNPRRPYVVGALWNGADPPPENAGGGGSEIRLIKSSTGVEIRIDDRDGAVNLSLKTPEGRQITLDDGNNRILIEDEQGNQVKISNTGIKVTAASKVEIEAGNVEVDASMVKVNAGISRFSGVVQCDTLITNSVVSSSYTPGAGNIW